MEANIKYSASLPSAALWAQSTHAVAKQLHYGKSHNATGVEYCSSRSRSSTFRISQSVGHSLLASGHGRGRGWQQQIPQLGTVLMPLNN